MLKRVRQVSILVEDIEQASKNYESIFGLQVCHRSELKDYGLLSAILPLENSVLELLQPVDSSSSAARYLEKKREGFYLLGIETGDVAAAQSHLSTHGVQVTATVKESEHTKTWLHPKGLNGVFTQLDQIQSGDNPWPSGGPTWQKAPKSPIIKDIRQVVYIVKDMEQALSRVDELYGLQPTNRLELHGVDAAYMPVGNGDTFLEIVSPIDPEHPNQRRLERGGEGIFLVIFDVYNMDEAIEHATNGGSQITMTDDWGDFRLAWLHPRTTNGAFFQFAQITGANPWPPGGPDWYKKR
jgi:methylmalonyl-CoA/ethylmalonyl-CoA epimerase